MPTQQCDYNGKIIGQTLFLGASVTSFNNSVGWGNQPSQLTINLVEDETPCNININQFGISELSNSKKQDNHYYTCAGDDCYVLSNKYGPSNGEDYDSSKHSLEDRMVPGKIYYALNSSFSSDPIISRYWYKQDPGFFGRKTRIDPEGNLVNDINISYQYDIIDTPVYFKKGDFSFCGLVQSWNRNLSNSGKSYTVNLYSMQSLLNSCYVIIDKYAGSIFTRINADRPYGSPKNFLGPYEGASSLIHEGHISKGNIPNVFNVYGFLESLGVNNFGIARNNERGMSANKIVDALHVLTSSLLNDDAVGVFIGGHDLDKIIRSDNVRKTAFSPFGRIITKHAQLDAKSINSNNGLEIDQNSLYYPISSNFNGHGIIPPRKVSYGNNSDINYLCEFLLDLSDLPRTPDNFRIQGPVISIMDLINTIADQTGQDIFIDTIPTVLNNQILYVIKVKTISRLSQPRSNIIENTLKEFECNNFNIVSNTIGKEKNETNARSLIIGGSQQRLYQAKNYRLAYTQTNFIYDDRTGEFVDYTRLGSVSNTGRTIKTNSSFSHGKIKMPNFFSTRNKLLGTDSNYSSIVDDEDDLQELVQSASFITNDTNWSDSNEVNGADSSRVTGNFENTKIIQRSFNDTWGLSSNERWLPLFYDVICPFFGFVQDEEITLKTDNNGDFRKIRPVWLDTWTGQLVVVIKLIELPEIGVSLSTLSGQDFFTITESEIRAAIAGFDNFMVYSLAKLYKPDLIEMLRRSYRTKIIAQLIAKGETAQLAEQVADQKTNWYWNIQGSNIGIEADGDPKPAFMAADIGDGSSYMPEDALRDLQILHQFIANIGKYYGKKYMVTAHNLQTYKDQDYSGIYLQTQVGPAYVFNGGGDLTYNYKPTNDGAWEEYGNFIDDSIVVGGPYWYTLSDDKGKIKPILGYNANYYFDYLRYSNCLMRSQTINDYRLEERLSEYWDFDTYLSLMEAKSVECNDENFVFPLLDISSIGTEYVLTNVISNSNISMEAITSTQVVNPALPSNVKSYDAHGYLVPYDKRKLYINTSIEEDFIYLDPTNLGYPKILVDAPGLILNHSNTHQVQDPSRTIIANTSIEDLVIYMRTTLPESWDYDWIQYSLSQTRSISKQLNSDDEILLGLYGNKSNQSSLMAEIAPKAAHPFFVAIPIKSNQYSYGPWTNYPYLEYTLSPQSIFPDGKIITQSSDVPPTCSSQTISVNSENALSAINNWITPMTIEVNEDFVPWNYGGVNALDSVAYSEIENKINYQNIIETAQVELPGLPAFNLGGNFAYGNIGISSKYKKNVIALNYLDIKSIDSDIQEWSFNDSSSFYPLISSAKTTSVSISYQTLILKTDYPVTSGPIITNIQTGMSPQGITTTYSFRTYTKKLGLFNKEQSDRIKRNFTENIKRNRQLASLSREIANATMQQRKFIDDKRLEKSQFGTQDFSSKLFGWSPVKVLVGRANIHMREPNRNPKLIEDFELASDPGFLNTIDSKPTSWRLPSNSDIGMGSSVRELPSKNEGASTSITSLSNSARISSDIGIYDSKEVNSQIENQYGLQSAMSLDGLLSPISFYPTLKSSTFSFSKYDIESCPFCKGTKKRKLKFSIYYKDGNAQSINQSDKTPDIEIYCDKCTTISEKLNCKLQTSSSTASSEILPPYIITSTSDFNTLLAFDSEFDSGSSSAIPINLVTLNPIVVPYGEFKNSNAQNYEGAHPDKIHEDITGESPAYRSNSIVGGTGVRTTREFRDRLRHSIEIVARGSVPPSKYQYKLKTSQNLSAQNPPGTLSHNQDYYNKDIMLEYYVKKLEPNLKYATPESNQRFFGLRGPLVMHGWGYDPEGYPVPNASDEPYAIDEFGRKKRFKLKLTYLSDKEKPVAIKTIGANQTFVVPTVGPAGTYIVPDFPQIYGISFNNELYPSSGTVVIKTSFSDSSSLSLHSDSSSLSLQPFGPETMVLLVKLEDDYNDPGGFEPGSTDEWSSGYKGSVISKTQKWKNNRWSNKIKLNEFYLNWAERPDLWPVGPIDLRWDEKRKVWTNPPSTVYKFVYVTLEQDLTKDKDLEETYPARGFLDDIEYNKDVLTSGVRKVVYIKDRSGYTAPRGVKLLCRYDNDSGFYEPISKPSIMTMGIVQQGNKATIEMNYVQGRQSGQIPTMTITFEDRFGYSPQANKKGMFTYMGGTWILTSVQQN